MLSAFNGFFASFGFIIRHRMGWLFLLPAVLWVLLAIVFFLVLQGPVDRLTEWIALKLDLQVGQLEEGLWRDVLAALDGAREVIVWIVLKIAIAYLMFTFNKYLVLVLMSPVLAYASERAGSIITGRVVDRSFPRLMKDALRGSLIAMRNGILELSISAVIWALTFILPFGVPFSVALLFLVSAYFYGFSMFDYVLEREGLGMSATTRGINKRLPQVVTNGALLGLLMKIPLLGMMFAPLMAAVGAVLALRNDPILAAAPTDRRALRE